MKATNPIKKRENPNEHIAPWYKVYSLDQQREMKVKHFASALDELNQQDSYQGLLHIPPYTAYRNNNKFTFGYRAEALDLPHDDPNLGQHVQLGFIGGKYPTSYIMPCDEAVTINATFKELCQIIEKIVQESSLKPFLMPPKTKQKRRKRDRSLPYIPHQGVWRYLKIRHSVAQDRYMVFLVNFTRHLNDTNRATYEEVLEKMKKALAAHEKVAVFSVQEYHFTLEPQPYDPVRILLDRSEEQEGTLCEKLRGCRFLISPTSFFQVNTAAAEKLYGQLYTLLEERVARKQNGKKNILLDMYCGTGSIGMTLAPLFDAIVGIDEVETAIQNAEKNRSMNRIGHARYVVGRCEDSIPLLEKILGETDYNLYIVVNPAREGLHRKVRKFIRRTRHAGLIYSSCNVATWVRDVADLTSKKVDEKNEDDTALTMGKSYLVDLFPHTKHYEILSSFS